MKSALMVSQHPGFGLAGRFVDSSRWLNWLVNHSSLIVAGPPRTKPGSKIRSSASRPASITAGLVNPISPVVQAS